MGNNKESYFHNAPVSAPGLGAHLISSNRLVSIGSPLRLRSPAGSPVSRRYLGEGEGRRYQSRSSPRGFSAARLRWPPPVAAVLLPSLPPRASCNLHQPRAVGAPLPCRRTLKRNPWYWGSVCVSFREGNHSDSSAVFGRTNAAARGTAHDRQPNRAARPVARDCGTTGRKKPPVCACACVCMCMCVCACV